jgi:hypothetical protein
VLLTKLRPEQGEAVERALAHDGFAIFAEQRTGKTLISLAVSDKRKPDILFIVCPKKALRVWREQMREHIKFDWPCLKIIIHYEGLSRNPKDRRYWRKKFRGEWADKKILLVVDEGHRIKGKSSMQSTMIRSLGRESDYRLLLTGTPFDKVREDAFAIMDFVEPGALEYTWEEFSDMYLEMKKIPTGNKNPRTPWRHFRTKIIGTRNNKRFRRVIQKYSFRVTLREAQRRSGRRGYLVRRRVVRFDLKPETRRVYNELETALVTEVRRKRVSTPLVVTLVAKLQQLAGGYLIHVEEKYRRDGTPVLTKGGRPKIIRSIIPVGREKLVELTKIVKGYPRRKKLVICVNYRHEIEVIGRQLERLGRSWKRIAGGDSFDGKFDTDTIVMQIRSGEAIDLADADTFIMYSWDYSNISHEQARFRILKFTSTRVNYIYLMANETVDEQIFAAVRHKRNITRLVIDRYRPKRRPREDFQSTRRDQKRA